jgi:hypothetical protein
MEQLLPNLISTRKPKCSGVDDAICAKCGSLEELAICLCHVENSFGLGA